MSRYSRGFVQIADLYRAYRKAKSDAFYESSHFHALAFARYEKSLHLNLQRLNSKLRDEGAGWMSDEKFIGGCEFFPKSIGQPDRKKSDGIHFATLDQFQDWRSSCLSSESVVKASFRQVITPTVDYQIVSALWIMKVGHQFDAAQDPECSYGHRLRRLPKQGRETVGQLNLDCNGLFAPYFSAYKAWRRKGLDAMRGELERGGEIFAVTMDIKQFYHSVSPAFAMRPEFLSRFGIKFSADQRKFTRDILNSIGYWYAKSPDYASRPAGGLPVGLSTSKILSNVLLVGLDQAIKTSLKPIYYGRYVDDIFLVIRATKELKTGIDFMRWLATRLSPEMSFHQEGESYFLKYRIPFALDSEIIFSGEKQKIFHLQGKCGLDLVDQISEQIRSQSSEHRLLPIIPHSESEMLSQALLSTPDASLEADALRKADTVSVRRLGFSLLLRDVESYARDLKPKSWRKIRHGFYGLVSRHVLTPRGFFDYFAYICRVFGLMIACHDFKAANEFLDRFQKLIETLGETSSAGSTESAKFKSAIAFYIKAFTQIALQSTTVKGFRFGPSLTGILRRLRSIDAGVPLRLSLPSVKQASRDLLVSDLGRRSYREYWYKENKLERNIPAVPKLLSINKVLRLGLIRNFRKRLDRTLNAPYWPAVAFPTRPLSIAEITAIAPDLLSHTGALRDAIFGLRGARVSGDLPPFAAYVGSDDPKLCISVPSVEEKSSYSVAVTNYLSSTEEWSAAYKGVPDRSLERYERFRVLLNSILASKPRPDYVVFPELSVPRRWAFAAAIKLSQNNVSLLSGLENNNAGGWYRNDALVSLTTKWPGYRTHVYWVQPKIAPAHHELINLVNPKRKLFKASLDFARPVYLHGNHALGLLVCSDLTSLSNRSHFMGCVDSLFVIEWNQDLNTFSYLVESASHDLHAFIVQANNREFGDSRVRGPFAKDHRRDVVRIRGGEIDYFAVAKLDIGDLREFQKSFSPKRYEKNKELAVFKPLPIGFKMFGPRKA